MAAHRFHIASDRNPPPAGSKSIVFWLISMVLGMCLLGLWRWADAELGKYHDAHATLMFFTYTVLSLIGAIYGLAGLIADPSRKWLAAVGFVLNVVTVFVVVAMSLGG